MPLIEMIFTFLVIALSITVESYVIAAIRDWFQYRDELKDACQATRYAEARVIFLQVRYSPVYA